MAVSLVLPFKQWSRQSIALNLCCKNYTPPASIATTSMTTMTKAKGFRQGDGPREENYGCLGKSLQNKHHPRRNTSFTSAFSWGIHMNQVSVRCDMRMYLWGLSWQSIILETFLRVIMECIVEPSLCLHMCLCICVYAVSVAYVCVCAHECARVHDYGHTGGGQIRTLGAFLSYCLPWSLINMGLPLNLKIMFPSSLIGQGVLRIHLSPLNF